MVKHLPKFIRLLKQFHTLNGHQPLHPKAKFGHVKPGAWCGWTIQSCHLGFSRRIFSRFWWQWRWLWCVSRTFGWQSAAGETWELLFSGEALICFLFNFQGDLWKISDLEWKSWCFPLVAQVWKFHRKNSATTDLPGFWRRASSLDS